jgi:hypothetical protein
MEPVMANRREAGQALIFTSLALVVLMGFAGLAIDVGVLRHEKRLQQTAADAAAIAGASNLAFGGVTSGAQDAASRVGFTDNGGGVVSNCTGAAVGTICVQVNNPPAAGPHAGDNNYVEALVAVVQPTYFMKVLSINSETITARAVATNLGGNGCLYTLGTPASAISGINMSGPAILNASSCGIVVNGDFETTGSSLSITADTFGVSGDSDVSGPGGSVTCTTPGPCPSYGIPAATDPLSQLTPPCTSCSGGNTINVPGRGNPCSGAGCAFSGGTYTISPGTYCSITINGNASDQVVFNPGVYIIDGSSAGCPSTSLRIPGDDTINGTGVTFYFTNSSTLNMTGTPIVNLTAPNSGPYAGILMYQDPNDTNTTGPSLGGNDGSNYDGVLYFPSDELSFVGIGHSINVAIVVSGSINFSGNQTVNLVGSAGLPPGVSLMKNTILVE